MKLVGGEVVRRWKRTLIYAIREVYESTRVDEVVNEKRGGLQGHLHL